MASVGGAEVGTAFWGCGAVGAVVAGSVQADIMAMRKMEHTSKGKIFFKGINSLLVADDQQLLSLPILQINLSASSFGGLERQPAP